MLPGQLTIFSVFRFRLTNNPMSAKPIKIMAPITGTFRLIDDRFGIGIWAGLEVGVGDVVCAWARVAPDDNSPLKSYR
jgi:hypothetical protein